MCFSFLDEGKAQAINTPRCREVCLLCDGGAKQADERQRGGKKNTIASKAAQAINTPRCREVCPLCDEGARRADERQRGGKELGASMSA